MNSRGVKSLTASLLLILAVSCGTLQCFTTGEVPADSRPSVTVDLIDTTAAWSSPCWGYNAPKIVRNAQGDLWAVNWGGKYGGHERAWIMKRTAAGVWMKGKEFDSLYQPSMIFLDAEGRLNYIQNAQYHPIRHYRSSDDQNLMNFTLVAEGNGVPDGRGWYVGTAVHGNQMYLSYVTLSYDLFYTWKNITDREWHQAVLVEKGVVDTVRGNHSWLYPRFSFFGNTGFITVSSTVDGSKYNTYDKVCLVTFPVDRPELFEKETVYNGAVGYYSYCYDTVILPDSTIICGFNAGRYRYGEKRSDMPPAGLYMASRKVGSREWFMASVDTGDGGLAFAYRPGDGLYALVTRGSWDKENHSVLKKSTDAGRTWTIVCEDVTASRPGLRHQFFGQTLHLTSGSSAADREIHALMTDHSSAASADGLYSFQLLLVTFQFR
jgi:hypothetical protein